MDYRESLKEQPKNNLTSLLFILIQKLPLFFPIFCYKSDLTQASRYQFNQILIPSSNQIQPSLKLPNFPDNLCIILTYSPIQWQWIIIK